MRITTLLYALCASHSLAASTSELIDSAIISLQPISASPSTIQALAEIKYNPSTLSAEIVSFEHPDLSSDPDSTSSSPELLRIGIFDATAKTWKNSVSTTSAESFGKGYACTIVLTLDGQGEIVGVSVKSSRIDAGATRDFGPRVKVRRVGKGRVPELNRPVVLSAEGKLEEPEVEKTMLQKYWWVLLGGMMLLLTTGGAE